jgi:hypothetical protein
VVEIRDQGGGFDQSRKDPFMFSYSTAPVQAAGKEIVMAGYGYGLPLSKLVVKAYTVLHCAWWGLESGEY